MTKKEAVLKLDDGTKTDRQIAALVGCCVSYVRTCRQRIGATRQGNGGHDDRTYTEPWAVFRARKQAERRSKAMAGEGA